MLVLTRKPGESIIITTPEGDEITITALRCERGQVKLGFSAPTETVIHRQEIHERILAERA